MNRPARRQWVVLWLGALWILVVLAVADEYVVRGVLAGLVITALLFWQLTPKAPTPQSPAQSPKTQPPPGIVMVEGTAADASSTSPKPAIEAAPETARTLEPSGVGGWLALLVFGLLVVIPLSIIGEISKYVSTTDSPWEFGGALIVLVLMGAGSVYAGIALVQKWSNAPQLATRYIVAVVFLSLLGIVFAVADDSGDAARTAGQGVGAIIWGVVWSSYLAKSRRVKNTYPQGGDQARRGLVRIGVGTAAMLLVWLGVTAYQAEAARVEGVFETLSPYQWIKAADEIAPEKFRTGFSEGVLKRLDAELPNSTITPVGNATFDDLSTTLRGVVRYTAETGTDAAETIAIEGEVRTFFHADGIAVIESACVPSVVNCSGMKELFDEAEKSLLSRLKGSQLSGILPAGNCSISSEADTKHGRTVEMVTCSYSKDNGALLTLARSTLEQAQADLRSSVTLDTESKRAMVRKIRQGAE
jgi:hypothetical protein